MFSGCGVDAAALPAPADHRLHCCASQRSQNWNLRHPGHRDRRENRDRPVAEPDGDCNSLKGTRLNCTEISAERGIFALIVVRTFTLRLFVSGGCGKTGRGWVGSAFEFAAMERVGARLFFPLCALVGKYYARVSGLQGSVVVRAFPALVGGLDALTRLAAHPAWAPAPVLASAALVQRYRQAPHLLAGFEPAVAGRQAQLSRLRAVGSAARN